MLRVPNMNKDEMRGLTQYIADLRACRVRELEEKRINKEMAHIRHKFKDGNLDGRQKKKYISKIIFTSILGYPVDVGHMEAVNLISSTKYSEKQIVSQHHTLPRAALDYPRSPLAQPLRRQGYLALTLLMHENSDLVRLIVNSIRKDLDALDETVNCLALHAIANIGGAEMAEALASDVHRLLISPTSRSFVKKKAALTLLRLYRKHPEVIPAAEWASRIVSIMDDQDLGVALAVASLVLTLAQDNLVAYAVAYQKAVDRLAKIVLENEYPSDYLYYKVPIPWLQVKLLRLLQYYPPSEDANLRLTLHKVLERILKNSQDMPKNPQHNNALNAVLFEAINLAIHLDTESTIVHSAALLLGRFISAKETNVRYLGLDTMTHLAARSDSLDAIKVHQTVIIQSLRDKDISVRRRGLDLLYSMCDTSNSKVIVSELLKYLPIADYTLREEMVLKIAILTEKFAVEYEWYVDTILKLMSIAGDHVGDEVWYRIVQIVTNTEELQEYAAQKVFDHLSLPNCHENILKVGAYILGEYGHLIADEEGRSPIEQFQLVNSRANLASASTKALLLTTYFKWLNLFPEIYEQIVNVFERYSRVLDAELQQRACEYLVIAKQPDDELLQVVADEMPPYPERESALLSRLLKKHGDTGDKRTWHIGGKDINRGQDAERYKGFGRRKMNATSDATRAAPIDTTTAARSVAIPEVDTNDVMSSLAGLDLSSSTVERHDNSSALLPPAPAAGEASVPLLGAASTATTPTTPRKMSLSLTHGSEKWLARLLYNSDGVLYEDTQLQVGVKTEFHGHQGRIAIFFGNKLSVALESLTATFDVEDEDALEVKLPSIVPSHLSAAAQVQQLALVESKSTFSTPPLLRISYLAGSHQELVLRLPVFLTKFIEPVQLSSDAFFERWKQIGGAPREQQKIFPIVILDGNRVDVAKQRKVVGGIRLGILEGVDPNPNNLVAAGVLHMSSVGKVGCLVRVEPNPDRKEYERASIDRDA
ncbi:BQ2448_4047 [Microbotryum intermedium]|uniref:AP-2 complex subunit alpha n=1 Tax=Microbotryum intermedium TaxID=269621 RepID=A0A238FFD1_9BASI|nr:BQ2448_4047 [Microbotryum intermedium]